MTRDDQAPSASLPQTCVDAHLQRSLAAIDGVVAPLTPAAMSRAPASGWNIGQILEHLGRAYERTAYILDTCAGDGRPRGGAPTFTQRCVAILIIDVGYFPRGVRAPEMTVPIGMPDDTVIAFARAQLHALDLAAARCLDRFGPGIRVADHPLLGGFTVPQWTRFHWRHTRHHVRQIAARLPAVRS